jgi:hypothetical protein
MPSPLLLTPVVTVYGSAELNCQYVDALKCRWKNGCETLPPKR